MILLKFEEGLLWFFRNKGRSYYDSFEYRADRSLPMGKVLRT